MRRVSPERVGLLDMPSGESDSSWSRREHCGAEDVGLLHGYRRAVVGATPGMAGGWARPVDSGGP
jgi:hypothetical protein